MLGILFTHAQVSEEQTCLPVTTIVRLLVSLDTELPLQFFPDLAFSGRPRSKTEEDNWNPCLSSFIVYFQHLSFRQKYVSCFCFKFTKLFNAESEDVDIR